MLSSVSNFLLLSIATVFSINSGFDEPNGGGHKAKTTRWAVQKTSTIKIQGSTNVNKFGCDIIGYYRPDTINCSEENAVSKLVTLNGDLQIDISKFNCHNNGLTNDLRKTLKAKEYPQLVIHFLSLERSPVIHSSKDILRGWVDIDLAGVTKRFEVAYTFIQTDANLIQLNGSRTFSFADFQLTPPKKMAGLIKVNDKFHVDFNLLLDPVE
jgi:YceI-like domain